MLLSLHLSQEADAIAQGMNAGVVVLLQRLRINTSAVPAIKRPASAGPRRGQGQDRSWVSGGGRHVRDTTLYLAPPAFMALLATKSCDVPSAQGFQTELDIRASNVFNVSSLC